MPVKERSGVPAGVVAGLAIAALALLGVGARYHAHGDFHLVHGVLVLFLSVNLPICYLEACLFLRRDYIERRAEYWRRRRRETGRTPAVEFLSVRVPFRRMLSPTVWADGWATFSQFDGSYADRRSYGFNADVANGFATALPTLVLYLAYSFGFLPAVPVGILGAMLFWQWVYTTSTYYVSFFVVGRQARLTRRELCIYIFAMSAPWLLCPLLGIRVSVRLILDGNYGVLGF